MRWLLGISLLPWLVSHCAAPPAAVPEIPATPIAIVSPSTPLPAAIFVRKGAFVRTRANAEGVLFRFRKELESAKVFTAVLDAPAAEGQPAFELRLAAADYGEPDAYTFELQGALVREREVIASYVSKQSVRGKTGSQLTIGPTELGQLAELAIRDVVRQIAADTERLRSEK
jgi:hypothetical protein